MMKILPLKRLSYLPNTLCASQLPASMSEPWETGVVGGAAALAWKDGGVDEKRFCPSSPVLRSLPVDLIAQHLAGPGREPPEFDLLSRACGDYPAAAYLDTAELRLHWTRSPCSSWSAPHLPAPCP